MLEHSCLLINAMVRGSDGLTAWIRVRGQPFSQQLVGFAENVFYKHPSKGPLHRAQGNIGAFGGDGTFLGYNMFSNTFTVSTRDGLAYY